MVRIGKAVFRKLNTYDHPAWRTTERKRIRRFLDQIEPAEPPEPEPLDPETLAILDDIYSLDYLDDPEVDWLIPDEQEPEPSDFPEWEAEQDWFYEQRYLADDPSEPGYDFRGSGV